jgi:hypothetical protein
MIGWDLKLKKKRLLIEMSVDQILLLLRDLGITKVIKLFLLKGFSMKMSFGQKVFSLIGFSIQKSLGRNKIWIKKSFVQN